MNLTLFLFSLLVSYNARADLQQISKFACAGQLKTVLTQWNVDLKSEWKGSLSETGKSFRIHGSKFGEWVIVSSPTVKKSTIHHSLANGTKEEAIFDLAQCDKTTWTAQRSPAQNTKTPISEFLDDELKILLESSKNGIIYVWSPNMSLSLKGIKDVTAAAKEAGLPVTLMMDPMADEEFAQEVIHEQNLPASAAKRMESDELAARGATLHYPALMIYRNSKVCETVQRGYRDQANYRKIIEKTFGNCL